MRKLLFKIRLFFYKLRNRRDYLDVKNILCFVNGELPHPLDSDEELDLLEKRSQGDESAFHKLIEHNLRLVVYISRRFENCGILFDDLISAGSIGLVKAIKTYQTDKQVKLATYASRCIENEILMLIRKEKKPLGNISLDHVLNTDSEGNNLTLEQIIPSDESVDDSIEKSAEQKALMLVLEKLPYRSREIIKLRYGLGGEEVYTQKEVAQILNVSQSYVSRLEKSILKLLRKAYMQMIS